MTKIRHEGKLGHTEHMGKETQNRSLMCDNGLRLEGICIDSRSQGFILTTEGLEYMAAFIGQGPPMRPFVRHVKQPITVSFVQGHVSGRGNVTTKTNQCVKLSDVF